jgi:hypothetical protein
MYERMVAPAAAGGRPLKAKPAWEAQGAGDNFKLVFHERGHGLTPETRDLAFNWLVDKLHA